MGTATKQLKLLLWKNLLVQKRSIVWTVFQILVPLMMAGMMTALRTIVTTEEKNATLFTAFDVTGKLGQDMVVRNMTTGMPTKHGVFNEANCFMPYALAYTPVTKKTTAVMKKMKTVMGTYNETFLFFDPVSGFNITVEYEFGFDYVGFTTEDVMVTNLTSYFVKKADASIKNFCQTAIPPISGGVARITQPGWNQYFGGVVFDPTWAKDANTDRVVKYALRFSNSGRHNKAPGQSSQIFSSIADSWQTKYDYPFVQSLGPRIPDKNRGDKPDYWSEGFLSVQRALDMAIIEEVTTKKQDDVNVQLKRYPYPKYLNNPFVTVIQQTLPYILVWSLCVTVLYIARSVTVEKELNLKEYMRTMGMKNWVQWIAYFIPNFVLLLLITIVMTALMCASIGGRKVIDNTDPSIIFIFLLIYALGALSFGFMVSTFFKKGNTAAGIGFVLWLFTYIPYTFVVQRYPQMTHGSKIACCFLLNTGMSLGTYVLGIFEGQGDGIQWSTINSPGTPDDDLTMAQIMLVMFIDAIICLIVTWYVERVKPGDQGVPLPLYFPFSPKYWCGSGKDKVSTDNVNGADRATALDGERFETEPHDKRADVVIRDLRKEYGSFTAVENLSLKMYFGQITALLGHNGAGKSTTMSMLTGLIPPTAGTAWIKGLDIRDSLDEIHKHLGLCPQYNALFPNLTVNENLKFFCMLKDRTMVETERQYLLTRLGLQIAENTLAGKLSGGMKRKLQLAVALIGGSEIVMLDEPTSGMDPGARHDTWHMLQEEKTRRAMLLTTHYMEEADLLGDRIAILAKGQLECCGSSLFLKNRYGAGYHLTVAFENAGNEGSGSGQNRASALRQVITGHVPSAIMQSAIGAEATFLLPHEDKDKFENLFVELETRQKEFGVDSFGVSVTTMEEVFLKVGEEADTKFQQKHSSSKPDTEDIKKDAHSIRFQAVKKSSGFSLQRQRFWALIVKRVKNAMRNYYTLFAQIAVPVIILILALTTTKSLPKATINPPKILDLHTFDSPDVTGFYTNSGLKSMASTYTDAVGFADPSSNTFDRQFQENDVDEHFLNISNKIGVNKFKLGHLVSAVFSNESAGPAIVATGYFNEEALHTSAMSLNALGSALLQRATGNKASKIVATNAPLPPSSSDQLNDSLSSGVQEFIIALNLVFAMSFLMARFSPYLVKERITKSKHLQMLAGVGPGMYWFTSFVCDFVTYLIPVFMFLILFKAFDVKYLVDGARSGDMLLLLIVYGLAAISTVYAISNLFDGPTGALIVIILFNILSGLIPVIVVMVLDILGKTSISKACDWAFTVVFSNYNLARSVEVYYSNQFFTEICEPVVDSLCVGYNATTMNILCCNDGGFTPHGLRWDNPGIGRHLVFLLVQFLAFQCFIFLTEYGIIRRIAYRLPSCRRLCAKKRISDSERNRAYSLQESNSSTGSNFNTALEDPDVSAERQFVAKYLSDLTSGKTNTIEQTSDSGADPIAMAVSELTKNYSADLCAVNKLSFVVKSKDCFGLLGANGAGKTSTFEMLTGANPVTSGDCILMKKSIKNDWREAGVQVGYCPQFDANIEVLTGREMLILFGRLRGVPESDLDDIVANCIDVLGIKEYENRQTKTYSGGNKRKLSLGLALIGLPPILLLDEPTNGVDPAARRLIWHVLSQLREHGTAVVLSSHSMEECEALCTRIAIMAHGKLRCLGTQQHLKSKFGNAYTLILRTASQDKIANIQNIVRGHFPSALLEDVHQNQLQYAVPIADVKWSKLFGTIYRVSQQAELGLVDYMVSQTTLEQVFLNITHAGNTAAETA